MQKKIDPGHASLCNSMPILLGGGGGVMSMMEEIFTRIKKQNQF